MNVEKEAVYGGMWAQTESTNLHLSGILQGVMETGMQGKCLLMVSLYMKMQRIKRTDGFTFRMICFILQSDTINMMHYYKGNVSRILMRNLQFTGCSEFFSPSIDVKRNIRKLSKGCRSRLPFGLRCICKPKLIVLDEPVDGL